jgi:hypothetical protein
MLGLSVHILWWYFVPSRCPLTSTASCNQLMIFPARDKMSQKHAR